MFCFHFHQFGAWQLRNEIPLWRHAIIGKTRTAAGDQPQAWEQYYGADKRLYSRKGPDLAYLLVGKLIEQARTCKTCGKIEYDWQKVTI